MEYRYWAFISYSSLDREWGHWLIRALETYRIPKQFVGRTTRHGEVPPRLFPIFRDRDELRAGGEVADALREALLASRYLIVICSPRSAHKRSWVNKEIELFKSAGRQDDVLALIVDGEPHASRDPERSDEECFPLALRYRYDSEGRRIEEPADLLASDVRHEDSRPSASRRKALLKLIARMIDVRYDELVQRDRRRRQRTAAAWGIAGTLLLSGTAAATLAIKSKTANSLSLQLAQEARGSIDTETDRALLLAALAYRVDPTIEAYNSLLETGRSNPHLVTYLQRADRVLGLAFDPQDKILATATCRSACKWSQVSYFDLQELLPVGTTDVPGTITDLRFQGTTGTLVTSVVLGSSYEIHALDAKDTSAPASIWYRSSAPISALATSPDGSSWAVATEGPRESEIKVFSDTGPRPCSIFVESPVRAIAFAKDAAHVAVVSERAVGWAELTVEGCKVAFGRTSSSNAAASFDASGRRLIVATLDGLVHEFTHVSDAELVGRITHQVPPTAVGWQEWIAPGAALLASDYKTHVAIADLAAHYRALDAIAEEQALGASDVALDQLRSQAQNVQVAQLQGIDATHVAFTNAGRLVATGDEQGRVMLWSIPGHSIFEVIDGEPKPATKITGTATSGHIKVLADEKRVGCDGESMRCLAWTELQVIDATTGRAIATLKGAETAQSAFEAPTVEFQEDGTLVVTRGMHTERWTLRPDSLIERACRIANRDLTSTDLHQVVRGWPATRLVPDRVCYVGRTGRG